MQDKDIIIAEENEYMMAEEIKEFYEDLRLEQQEQM